MACTDPRTAWKYGIHRKSGKQKLVFKDPGVDGVETQLVPCGRCVSCKLDYSREWATRMAHEMQTSKVGCFLTLTIDDKNMVKEGFWRAGEYYPPFSLYKRSLQLFFKRLRKALARRVYDRSPKGRLVYQKVRYVACGEYGDKYSRPHYHACVFGFDFPDKRFWKISSSGEEIYRSKLLEKLWTYGFSSVGSVTFQSAAYVARYTLKKSVNKRKYEHIDERTGEWLNLLPEFLVTSKGIGSDWFDKYKCDTDKDYVVIDYDKRVKVPRYYDKRREAVDPASLVEIKVKREERAKLKQVDDTKERRVQRDIVKSTQEKMLTREFDKGEDYGTKEVIRALRPKG